MKPFNYQQDFANIDFRHSPERYQAAAAAIFKRYWGRLRADEDYLARKKAHQQAYG
ncbi:hypothetical protein PMPD1_1585 [Paramixta manurensis]|uniref:Uncharacterized protein n=1 Tax=Paramixta manurensis TaxID=2740817 RepID=A0A6M8U768_9GAMM|nr:hypothetical protein PMPD1_1585 [Erwiniaceae bacterium PD-1]